MEPRPEVSVAQVVTKVVVVRDMAALLSLRRQVVSALAISMDPEGAKELRPSGTTLATLLDKHRINLNTRLLSNLPIGWRNAVRCFPQWTLTGLHIHAGPRSSTVTAVYIKAATSHHHKEGPYNARRVMRRTPHKDGGLMFATVVQEGFLSHPMITRATPRIPRTAISCNSRI